MAEEQFPHEVLPPHKPGWGHWLKKHLGDRGGLWRAGPHRILKIETSLDRIDLEVLPRTLASEP
jgi:hypothetical protein